MAYPIPVFINGKCYEWADILINIMSAPLRGAVGIEYADKQSIKNVFAAGRKVSGRVYGQEEPTASIELLMADVEALQAVSPTGRLQDIPEFPINVMYLDLANKTVKHVLKNCKFMDNSRQSNTGDGEIKVKIELCIAEIVWK